MASEVINSWQRKSPEKLAAYAINSLEGTIRNQAMEAAISELAKTGEFQKAQTFFAKMSFSRERASTLDKMASYLALDSVDNALKWVGSLGVADERATALDIVIREAADTLNVTDLVEHANNETSKDARRSWIAVASDKLVSTDLPSAVEWAKSLPPEFRLPVERKIAVTLAQSDLYAGTRKALTITDNRTKRATIDKIASDLMEKNVGDAAKWMISLPPFEQEHVAGTIASRWFDIDSEAVSEWVESLPRGRARDQAIVSTALRLVAFDKKSATQLLGGISDPEIRRKAGNLPTLRP